MAKRLRFLYRYLTTPYRLRRWLNVQTLIVFIVSLLFFAALIWTKPGQSPQGQNDQIGQIQTSETLAPGPTRAATLSAEYLANSKQTIGLTLVGALLVIIVVVGVLVYMPLKDDG